MIITKGKNDFVFKTRIDFEIDGNEEFVVLREMTTAEKSQVMAAGKLDAEGNPTDVVGMLVQSEKYFAGCVIESSAVDEEGNAVKGSALYDYLKQSSSVFHEILSTWIQSKRIDLSIKKPEGGNPLA